ncbi:MAG: hypothetical protein U9Q94_03870, partial [Candidatus Bipolaricaulota bacterium]|nr:hypothetical protein [Candidatus Bipolaricaulota bacterium]
MKLEDLKSGSSVHGIVFGEPATVVHVEWIGSNAVDLTFKRQNGEVKSRLLYRDTESQLELIEPGTPWAFNADGHLFQLASEAYRIQLGYLFDPLLAVH